MSNIKKIDVIGVQMDFGASKKGVNMGPLAVRHAGFIELSNSLGFEVLDKGNIIPPTPQDCGDNKMKYCKEICIANNLLFEDVSKTLREKSMPVVFGGDHSISAGSIEAARCIVGNIGIIWVDAHGDFNNEQSTPSGNMHGMPLSALCGYGPEVMVNFGQEIKYINPKNVSLIAVRDLDTTEKEHMKKAGVNVFTMSDIENIGISKVTELAIEAACNDTNGVYVSYDMDAIDPSAAPGVGTPIPNGLTLREAFFVAEKIAKSGKIIGIDVVEVNPMLDTCNITAQLACNIALTLLGKTVY